MAMIKYLEYEGKKYPIRVTHWAYAQVEARTGKSMQQLSQMQADDLYLLLYYSMKLGAMKAKQEQAFDLKEEDMPMVMDEVYFDFVQMIPEFLPKNLKAPLAGAMKKATEKK